MLGNWASRDVECETVEVEIGTDSQVDTWKLIKPISYYPGKEGDIHGIFIKKNPLNQFNGDVEVEDITKRLFNLAMSWLDRDSVNPINVDSSFRLVCFLNASFMKRDTAFNRFYRLMWKFKMSVRGSASGTPLLTPWYCSY